MIIVLILLLVVAVVIIYKLNETVEDDKVIKSNFSWKERIVELKSIIEYLESQEEQLERDNMTDEINKNRERIKSYGVEILKLQASISNNNLYLKDKGKLKR